MMPQFSLNPLLLGLAVEQNDATFTSCLVSVITACLPVGKKLPPVITNRLGLILGVGS